MSGSNGIMDVEATIICERDSHKGIIIGKGGAMLKRIGSAARRELEAYAGDEGEPADLGQRCGKSGATANC